jgi:serine/threonine protein kinase
LYVHAEKLPANNKDNKNRSSIYPIKLIKYMTQNDCENRLQLPEAFERSKSFKLTSTGELEKPKNSQKGSIQFSRDYILGSGSYGQVYLGIWSGSIAAVKRINITPRLQIVIERETELEQLDHCNVVKFYGYDQDSDFM